MEMQLPSVAETSVIPAAPVADRALACVLEYAAGARVAMPIHAGVELVEEPPVIPVPGMPDYALGLMAWQGRQLALIDLARYLGMSDGMEASKNEIGHVLVVAYQTARGEPIEYGALRAPYLVRMIEVGEGQGCPLPSGDGRLRQIAVSCFSLQDQAIPVIDLARIFAPPPT